VDYPGEWLLDLPLMNLSYRQWSEATIAASRMEPRASLAKAWHAHLATLDAESAAIELNAVKAAEHFTAYLAKCREDDVALSSLLPGRFLMPGDFAGSPLLTFAPLTAKSYDEFPKGSLGDLMERRYDSYVSKIVRPFFFNHFARLDRQIVLVDTLSALNAGPAAVQDLKNALTQVLACFRLGANSVFSNILGRRIDRILFAATKADLLHQTSHDRLENILRLIIEDASAKAEFSGATIDVAALAAIRATREAKVKQKNEDLPCIAGIPQKGEKIGGTTFDGESEVAIFPGDLPANSLDALDGTLQGKLKFVRFRPPPLKDGAFPHIRLDRSLEFLLGDRFA
jgi:predicted YcjX-like family ATPase